MARLWIGNVEDGTSDAELQQLLTKYGFPDFNGIEHVPGAGNRPAVVCTFEAASPEALQLLVPRIHDLFWKHRHLSVHVVHDSFA